MKKIISGLAVVLALGVCSCSSLKETATTIPVETSVVSASTADLAVSPTKISYTLRPSKAVRKTGEKAVIQTTVAEALKANGNADVLVGMQYEIKKTRNFFGVNNIKYVTVTGYPATYTNVTPVKK